MPHLQPLIDAQLYDWECRHVVGRTDQDVRFYLDVAARQAGPVLELACGTGRVTAPLAAAGHEVVGVDLDPVMLGAARAKYPDLPLVCADMRRFTLHRRFPLVVIAYNGLQLLDPVGREQCLTCVREHLTPGGVLAFEVSDFSDAAGGCDETLIARGAFAGQHVELFGRLDHDATTDAVTYHRRWVLDDTTTTRSTTLWPVSPEAVAASGFPVAVFSQAGAPR